MATSSAGPAVVVIGSANMDMVIRAPHVPAPGQTVLGQSFRTIPGGKGANQAVAAARLARTAVLSAGLATIRSARHSWQA